MNAYFSPPNMLHPDGLVMSYQAISSLPIGPKEYIHILIGHPEIKSSSHVGYGPFLAVVNIKHHGSCEY